MFRRTRAKAIGVSGGLLLALLGIAPSAQSQQKHDRVVLRIPQWVTQSPSLGLFAAVDLDCANARSWPVGALGQIAVTRASIGTEDGLDGTVYTFPSGALRITNKGCLIEESRVNSILHSQFDSTWLAGNVTGTANAGIAPDKTTTAVLVVSNTSVVSHVYQSNPGLTLTAAGYSYSVYAKANGYGFANVVATTGASKTVRYSAVVNLTTGAVTQNGTAGSPTGTGSSAVCYANGWCRIQLQLTATADTTGSSMTLTGVATGTPTVDVNLNPTDAGDGTSGVLFWGAQIELGTFTTSYIPTTTVAVTRAADVATLTLPAGACSTTACSVLAIGTPAAPAGFSTNQFFVEIGDGTVNNRLGLFRTSSSGLPAFINTVAGNAVQPFTATALTSNTQNKLIGFNNTTSSKLFTTAGNLSASLSQTNVASVKTLAMGQLSTANTSFINGYISRITVAPFSLLNN